MRAETWRVVRRTMFCFLVYGMICQSVEDNMMDLRTQGTHLQFFLGTAVNSNSYINESVSWTCSHSLALFKQKVIVARVYMWLIFFLMLACFYLRLSCYAVSCKGGMLMWQENCVKGSTEPMKGPFLQNWICWVRKGWENHSSTLPGFHPMECLVICTLLREMD